MKYLHSKVDDVVHIYEVVVRPESDGAYHTLGLYLDQSAACKVLEAPEPPLSEYNDDSVIMEVRKRKIGWEPYELGELVAKRTWVRWYSEDVGGSTWK